MKIALRIPGQRSIVFDSDRPETLDASSDDFHQALEAYRDAEVSKALAAHGIKPNATQATPTTRKDSAGPEPDGDENPFLPKPAVA